MNSVKPVWQHQFAFIGAGNMASAFILGFIDKKVCKPDDIVVYRKNPQKNTQLVALGVHACTDYVETFSTSRYIFLGVKPGQVFDVLTQLKNSGADYSKSVFISICAAIPCDYICKVLDRDVPVIRVMPSTPITVGLGTAAVSKNQLVDKKDFQLICQFISRVAEVSVIPEDKQNAIISVNGSSPAYFYLFVKAMLENASKQGIDESAALPLVLKTMEGAAEMIRRSGKTVDELITAVCSPGGTTLAALNVFDENNIKLIISDAMDACTGRAHEIEKDICNK